MIEQTWNITKKLLSKFRYGIMIYFLLSRLQRLGIEICPYYWVQEGIDEGMPNNFDKIVDGYTFEPLGIKDMETLSGISDRENKPEDELVARLKKGNICIGAKYQNEIAAFTWCDFTGEAIPDRKMILRAHEAYLFDMHTMKQFRGHNIAPHLRYQCYRILKELEKTTYYSISEAFNAPSIKFKRKLNARFLELRLKLSLFNRFKWDWKIKNCQKIIKEYEPVIEYL